MFAAVEENTNAHDMERESLLSVDSTSVRAHQHAAGEHTAVPVVTGWKVLGFKLRNSYGSSAPSGPMTDGQRAERKTLIANNKLMQSATTVRREFVKDLLANKQALKGWQYFTAITSQVWR
ncbi:hypothetical protein GCM10027404_32490 [Arthrobacter tumbae]|uniref:hypothetical protein n=1 Tax=Arthrobacter tumbae TaxID=163874 RepID=UPI003557FF6C|nr:hypothetical protein [Arthrobacter tumbae]